MGRNESTEELLVKVWEEIREFLEVLNESTGSFFRHMRVRKFSRGQYSRKPTEERLSFLPRKTCFLNRNGFLVLIKFCTNVKGKQALKTFHLCASE